MASEASDDQSTAQNNQKLINSRLKSVTSHEIGNNIVKMLRFFSLFHNVVYEWSLKSLSLSCNESDVHYLDCTFLPVPNHQCVT